MSGDETPKAPPAASIRAARQSRSLAETIIQSFVQRLSREADARDGWLSADDIRDIGDDLVKRTDALQSVFEKSFEEYVPARERAALN